MPIAYSESLNHGRFETWTEKPDLDMVHVTQVHGTDIASLSHAPCEADGIHVLWPKLERPLAIKTADCLPIVIEGEKGVVFLHAGWRGLAHGILSRPEVSDILPLRAFIGPSIHSCCFEVSPDFREHFPHSPFFQERDGKLFFDLQEEAKAILRNLFSNLLIERAPICTCCNEKFHSHRRDKTPKRNWNLYRKG